jgi:hypothetical protein
MLKQVGALSIGERSNKPAGPYGYRLFGSENGVTIRPDKEGRIRLLKA